jgi:DNA-binding transcriptional ArsR family regulator
MIKSKVPIQEKGNVVEVGFSKKPRRRPEDKWTKGLISLGYCTVPSILLWAQGRLKLRTEQFTLLMQLADFWWDAGEPPFPTKEMLAVRMGMGARQVQRRLTKLEEHGLIERIPRYRGPKNQIANGYSMNGLVAQLVRLEPEFRAMIEQKRRRRQRVEAKAS